MGDPRDGMSAVEKIIYDQVVETRNDVKSIDRRLAKAEVRSGIIGGLSALLVVLTTKLKMLFTGSP